jgi:hypothetical protein
MHAPFVLAAFLAFGAGDGSVTTLQNARRLSDELRFEEAVVEYQRYLNTAGRPPGERAQVLLELGFLHGVLGDEASAKARALEALELDPGLKLPPDAPTKQVRFLEQMQKELGMRVRLELLPAPPDAPREDIRVRLTDLKGQTRRVLLRHAIAPTGPYYSTLMVCEAQECSGRIPPLRVDHSYNAWYFIEAQDAGGDTLALARSATDAMQVTVQRSGAWYKNPWVWGGTAAVLLGASAIVFFASPQPAR